MLCLAKYKNRHLSRLSLSSYFIPFVRGTRRTGLQRRLQWAHQSMPTDCGPTDTLEVGINFFVENVEKASTKWGNESSFFSFVIFLPPSSCFSLLFRRRITLSVPHVEGAEGQAGTLFSSDARLGRFPSSPLSSFLTFFLSLALPLADSSDKLSLSSAHMALGENQCPYVSSAALHWTDEG